MADRAEKCVPLFLGDTREWGEVCSLPSFPLDCKVPGKGGGALGEGGGVHLAFHLRDMMSVSGDSRGLRPGAAAYPYHTLTEARPVSSAFVVALTLQTLIPKQ